MTALNQFLNWHYDLKEAIESIPVISNFQGSKASLIPQEKEYFDGMISEKSTEYFQQLKELALECHHYTYHQKKQVFESDLARELQQLLKNSPFYYHSIFKPRGYVGDAEVMAMFYRNQYEGSDPFSRFIHRVGMESPIGQAIRNRKDWMIQALEKHQPADVLSLAAGPAEEIKAFQQQEPKTSFLALDHDIQTLQDAKTLAPAIHYGIINAFHLISGQNRYLVPRAYKLATCQPKQDTKGWRRLLLSNKYHIQKLEAESYDLVYSIGLFDYIKTFHDLEKGASALTAKLFQLLRPGGRLIIGNISPEMPIGIRWIMECICDWHLIYRDKAQLNEFTRAIPPAQIKTIDIDTEPLGINWMMTITKR